MATASRRMDYLPWNGVAEALKTTDVVMIPVGAIEPHGRHAPLGTDTFIALEVAERLAQASGGLVFPPIPLGCVHVLYDFRSMAGTISLDPRLLIDLYTNIGVELARSGFRRLVFVNGHAPNSSILGIAAYLIREKARVEVGILEWWTAAEAEIKSIKGYTFASHADEIETSVVLASAEGRPLVDLQAAVVNSTRLEDLTPDELEFYRARVPYTRTWDERWIGTSGNMGDPTPATAEKGDRILAAAVAVGVRLLDVLNRQHEAASAGHHREGPSA